MTRSFAACLGSSFSALALACSGCAADADLRALDDWTGEDRPAFEPSPIEPPAAPVFAPCPPGWRETTDPDDGDVVTCDPWPEAGAVECAAVDEAHFPGEAGCRRVGSPCPEGDWADDLPAGGEVVYVRAGAEGGDGTRELPYGSVDEGLRAARSGEIVAISKGTFDEELVVGRAVTLWGACVAETVLASSSPTANFATLELVGPGGGTVKNLRISGERPGVWVYSNAEAWVLAGVVVDRARGAAVISDLGGRMIASDLVVRDTRGDSMDLGYGLEIFGGAVAEIERGVFERNLQIGLYANGAGTTLTATDVAVRGTLPAPDDGEFGIGLDVNRGASARIERAIFEDNRTMGIRVLEDASMDATDLVVSGTLGTDGDGFLGTGLYVSLRARAVLSRALFEGNRETGVRVFDDAEVVATDLVARATLPEQGSGYFGSGLHAYAGGRAQIRRARFDGNHEAGVLVYGAGSDLHAEDVRVSRTRSGGLDGRNGDGIQVHSGASATVARVILSANRRFGLGVHGAGTQVAIEDVEIDGTLPQDCAEGGCEDDTAAGLGAAEGGVLAATRLRARDNSLAGIQLVTGGQADLFDGVVSGHPIGAIVRTMGFDLARLQARVLYLDNARSLDSVLLPVPTPITGSERAFDR